MSNTKNIVKTTIPAYFLLIMLVIGLLWFRSSYGKFTSGTFVDGLGNTLHIFASKNPHIWYKNFLTNMVIPNATVFGLLTMWGELLTAITITASSSLLVIKNSKLAKITLAFGLLCGAFLNATFWLASGWTSLSTDSLNLLMFTIEVIAAFAFVKSSLNSKSFQARTKISD